MKQSILLIFLFSFLFIGFQSIAQETTEKQKQDTIKQEKPVVLPKTDTIPPPKTGNDTIPPPKTQPDSIPPASIPQDTIPVTQQQLPADTIPEVIQQPVRYDSLGNVITEMPTDTIPPVGNQTDLLDSLRAEIPTDSSGMANSTNVPLLPPAFVSSLGVQVDYGKFSSFFLGFETKYEAGIFVKFKNRYQVVMDIGKSALSPVDVLDDNDYRAAGTYMRAGADYVMAKDPSNRVFGGLRYGKSNFSDQAQFFGEDPYLEQYPIGLRRDGFTADWFEVVLGTEGQFMENLDIGFLIRMRILYQFEQVGEGELPVYRIPGYGRPEDKTSPALNIFMRYGIRFKSTAEKKFEALQKEDL
ncbi:DUF6048 family protein [Peijinzhouia sedimentorum]